MSKNPSRPRKPARSHSAVLRAQLALLEAAEQERLDEFQKEQSRRFGPGPNFSFDTARSRLFEIQDAVAQKRVALAQIEGAEAQTAASRAEAENYATREDATFWLRRFIVSLSIGNGAAFAALAAGALQNDDPQATANLVEVPLHLFALGLVAAGTIPLIMWVLRVLPSVVGFFTPNPAELPEMLQRVASYYRASLPGLLALNAVAVAGLSALFFLGGLASVTAAARHNEPRDALRAFFNLDSAWGAIDSHPVTLNLPERKATMAREEEPKASQQSPSETATPNE